MRQLRLVVVAAAVALLVTAAAAVPLPVYLEQPGQPISLGDVVEVELPEREHAALDGDFLLTVVTLERATAVQALAGLVNDSVALVPVDAVTGGLDQEAYFAHQRSVFKATTDLAAAVGLEAAGLLNADLSQLPGEGARVVRVNRNAPAAGVLRPGDVITAVNGEAVNTAEQLVDAVTAAEEFVTVTYRRGGTERQADIELGDVAGREKPGLGVLVQAAPATPELPVPVEVSAGHIGGPSAALMIALTVYDKAAPVDLAASRQIAGTGGLAVSGAVQPIGGIRQKVIGAVRGDVGVFLVPRPQLGAARDALPPNAELTVHGVSSFKQAVDVLRQTADDAPS